MSLFIGNISSSVDEREYEDSFKKYGTCSFRTKGKP